MVLFTGVQNFYLQYSCPSPLVYSLLPNVWTAVYTISTSIFADVPYWLPYSTDKFFSCVVPCPSHWFFYFGEEILIAWTHEKQTLGGTESHYSSWQCKASHLCCHGALALLAMGDSGTSTVLTRYESTWLWYLHHNERTTVRDPVQHKRWTYLSYHHHHHHHHQCSAQRQVLHCKWRNLGCSSAEGREVL